MEGSDVPEAATVTLETNVGNITFELYDKHAPKACKNFAGLAKSGYYDGVKVSRTPLTATRRLPSPHATWR